MLTLPVTMVAAVAAFASCFSPRVWRHDARQHPARGRAPLRVRSRRMAHPEANTTATLTFWPLPPGEPAGCAATDRMPSSGGSSGRG
jgi:hypothetical protein